MADYAKPNFFIDSTQITVLRGNRTKAEGFGVFVCHRQSHFGLPAAIEACLIDLKRDTFRGVSRSRFHQMS